MDSLHGEASRLPPELERQIFEIAALSRPVTIPRPMLVAWRVNTWVEPLLYRIVFLTDTEGLPHFTFENILRLIREKPAGFMQKSVRHLYLWLQHKADMAVILPACTDVVSLFLVPGGGEFYAALGDMRNVRRLAIEIGDLLMRQHFGFTHPFFHTITHLEAFDDEKLPSSSWAGLTLAPYLTHFAFRNESETFLDIAADTTLLAWPRLHCLVLLSNLTGITAAGRMTCERLANDPRFVAISLVDFAGDWLCGARLGHDYWVRAEVFVADKQAEKVASSEYQISIDHRSLGLQD
ncbi:hypothetical protein DFH09DRAFT_1325811 [Mycena vulgaris]|nr:hypothetical protein DFH09DRAFT_1325811 [Mycena vulgaris]